MFTLWLEVGIIRALSCGMNPSTTMKRTTILLCAVFTILTANLPAREIPQVAPAKAGLSETKLAAVDQFMERQERATRFRQQDAHAVIA